MGHDAAEAMGGVVDANLFGYPDGKEEAIQGLMEGMTTECIEYVEEWYDDVETGPSEPPEPVADHFETMDFQQMNRVFFQNSMMSVGAGLPKLPWEEGVFAQIFGDGDLLGLVVEEDFTPLPAPPVFALPDGQSSAAERSQPSRPSEMPLLAKHVRSLCDNDYKQAIDLKWTKALACWLTLLEGRNFDSQAGHYVMEKLTAQNREGALTYIRDACGVRSPSTVLKRGRDLQQFVSWRPRTGKRWWWPLQEVNLLDHLGRECISARWSDLASMQSFFFDVIDTGDGPFGFVEGRTRVHKTSNTAEKKALHMPFVAPIWGVGKDP
eukprot:s178_g53.t1